MEERSLVLRSDVVMTELVLVFMSIFCTLMKYFKTRQTVTEVNKQEQSKEI